MQTARRKPGHHVPMKGYLREYGWAYLFILAPVLLFLIFTLYPVASAFLMSFQEYSVMGSNGLERTTTHGWYRMKCSGNP